MSGSARAKAAREARRTSQFSKFRNTELNLIPLVDTLVSVVFFSLATATVGEMAPVVSGVELPIANIGAPALRQLTVGVARDVSVDGVRVMSSTEAAGAVSNIPQQPLIIPGLLTALKEKADSIRTATGKSQNESVEIPLAVQGTKTMRYDLLSRVLHTARWAGFVNVTLQVQRETGADGTTPTPEA